MKIILIFSALLVMIYAFPSPAQELQTPFEKNRLVTTTYDECISFYKSLAAASDMIKIEECGLTDCGRPLNLIIVSKDKVFDPIEIRQSGKIVMMINNGIHPGEPDGIDACMMFIRDIVRNKNSFASGSMGGLLDHIVIIAIPIYNIDGALNRNDYSRANQYGPKEYGFRANAENMDLNRDFIKCDTKNTRSFIEIFRKWKPQLFLDTHTTDGDDYQYKMSYIATNTAKLEATLASYLAGTMIPAVEQKMKARGDEMCRYVETYRSTPDSGMIGFLETPRYSTGYAALFNTIGFVSESHMLKTHAERVEASYNFMLSLLEIASDDWQTIRSNKERADLNSVQNHTVELNWKLDMSSPEQYTFKGYGVKFKKSTVTGYDRVFYDHNAPWEKPVNYFNKYVPSVKVVKPLAYVVPQAWWRVIELLQLNGVEMKPFVEDRTMMAETYYIGRFETQSPPFEGHYLHSNPEITVTQQKRKFYKGDYLVYTDQPADKFIVSVLEPQGVDSYFNWNFFDAILQQKEYFDPYVFDDFADSLLGSKPGLRAEFEQKKKSDEKFRTDPQAQLTFIYDHTIREPEFMRYPVARIIGE